MFDKSMIESYKKVKASEGLRERVTGNLYSKGIVLKKRRCCQMAFAVTACIFLIFSGVAFEQYGRVSISFQGEKLTGEPVAAKEDEAISLQSEPVPAKRSVLDERCITLEIDGKHRIEWNTMKRKKIELFIKSKVKKQKEEEKEYEEKNFSNDDSNGAGNGNDGMWQR